MSEFKFACPVCGQHITADSTSSGSQLECPTCFQKIVVPQAPASPDGKLILSAAQVAKPRPNGLDNGPGPASPPLARKSISIGAGLLVLVVAAGAALFFFRQRIFHPKSQPPQNAGASTTSNKKNAPPKIVYPVPTNINWTLDLTNAVFPDMLAAGSIHGSGFVCEKAVLQGGNLTLRQGPGWPPELGVGIQLFAHQGEELSKKSIEVTPDKTPPLPRVVLRWKNDLKPAEQRFIDGYALKLAFGEAANGRIPGKIYICLPDDTKSFVAGAFEAEIRKPPPPKPKQPKPPKPKAG